MDDATGRLMHLRFSDSENAFDYIMATRQYLDKQGKPDAFYSDNFYYPDGSIAFRHLHRPLDYRISCIDQGAVVDNKRLGVVLRLA